MTPRRNDPRALTARVRQHLHDRRDNQAVVARACQCGPLPGNAAAHTCHRCGGHIVQTPVLRDLAHDRADEAAA